MRFVVRVLALIIGSGAVTQAFADPAAPTQQAPAPASASTPPATAAAPASVAAPTAAMAPASSAPPTASAATPAKPAIDADEKRLLAEGYKPEMRGGTKVYCKREPVLGSRLGAPEHCGTAEQLRATTQMSREATEMTQRQGINPTGK
jgi:hypothetical protein